MNPNIIKIISIIILVIIICWILYKYFIVQESFTSDSLDLLDKQTSNIINNNSISQDGTTITVWSNKFYNFQTNKAIKPLSFWKPTLPISNGKTMFKLGDMISTSEEYSPPTDKSLFVNGDVMEPIDYKVIVDFKGISMDPIFNNLNNYITNINDLNNLYNSLKNTVSFVNTINSILINGKNEIISTLLEHILNSLQVGVKNKTQTLTSLITSTTNTTPLSSISSNDQIVLPAGCIITISKLSSDSIPLQQPSPIVLNFDLNNNITNSKQLVSYLSSKNYFANIKSNNISFITSSVGLMDIPNISTIINNYITTINQELQQLKINNTQLYNTLNLDSFINSLSTYLTSNFTLTYSHPVITLPVSSITNSNIDLNSSNLGYTMNTFNKTVLLNKLQNLPYPNDITKIPSFMNSPLSKLTNGITILGNIGKSISDNNLDMFSIKIVEPIAPPHYKCLGHIFMNNNDSIENLKYNSVVGCVPESCVKEVRNWRITDMVFEYNSTNNYFNIFYNPYVGTFIATTKRGIPSGKLCKVVACVKPCTVVDELIKADQCARDLQKINKSIKTEKPLALSISTNEEDTYYLDKIAKQSSYIAMLEKKAKELLINTDKADIINQEYNKSRLQNFVDTQARNINIVMDRLKQDRNSVDIDVNIPLETVNYILNVIRNSDTLSTEDKNKLLQSILDNKKLADQGLITGLEYKKILNKALKTCNDFDTNGFVRKDIASQVCYGCTDPK